MNVLEVDAEERNQNMVWAVQELNEIVNLLAVHVERVWLSPTTRHRVIAAKFCACIKNFVLCRLMYWRESLPCT